MHQILGLKVLTEQTAKAGIYRLNGSAQNWRAGPVLSGAAAYAVDFGEDVGEILGP
jgi:hypothetical protein